MARPSFRITSTCPGSDLAGETAAALAAASIAFRPTDPAYADTLLTHARQLYTFADTFRGKYSDCITDAAAYYNSWSGYNDELVWGAIWLYRATGEAAVPDEGAGVLREPVEPAADDDQVVQVDARLGRQVVRQLRAAGEADRRSSSTTTTRSAGSTGGRSAARRSAPTARASPTARAARRCSTSGARCATRPTPRSWRSCTRTRSRTRRSRRATTTSRSARSTTRSARTRSTAASWSGFGDNPPRNPHHRTAHGSWTDSIQNPTLSRHILYGALVGGPKAPNDAVRRRPQRLRDERGRDRLQRGLHRRAGAPRVRVRRHAASPASRRRSRRTATRSSPRRR